MVITTNNKETGRIHTIRPSRFCCGLHYIYQIQLTKITLYPLTFFNLFLHPLEVVPRYRDPQLQVGENYAQLSNLRTTI